MADIFTYRDGTGTSDLTPRGITQTQAENLARPAMIRALQGVFGDDVTASWVGSGKLRVTFPVPGAISTASLASAADKLRRAVAVAEREIGGSGRFLLPGDSAPSARSAAPAPEQKSQIVPTGGTVGTDSGRRASGSGVRVSGRWAQNAINAYRSSRSGALIAVDGRAGPVTVRTLREIATELNAASPAPTNDPSSRSTTDAVIISPALENALSSMRAVSAPARTRRSGTTAGTAVMPDGTERPVLGEEPDSLQEYLPYIIGGSAAFVALGLGVVIWRRRQPIQRNRHRRSR